MQLPPPTHGASIINSYVINSRLIKDHFAMDLIDLQFSKSIKTLGKFSFKKIFTGIFYGFIILKKILFNRPDLVYFTLSPNGSAFYRDALYIIIFKIFRLKVLFHLHGKGIRKASESSWLNKKIYKLVFHNAYVICLVKNLVYDIENVSSAVPFIVPLGIPENAAMNQPDDKKMKSKVQVLYLSNYIESKGLLVLIDALRIIKDKGYFFNARLVGAAADLTIMDVENYVSMRDLKDCVEITGPKYGNDKHAEFNMADIFVFPTYYYNETFGLVNLEAMQHGLPVISTSEGGIADVVLNNETGFIVEPRNADELAQKLAILIENKELREAMGKKGQDRYLSNYTLQHFETNMLKTFKILLPA